MSGVTCGDFQGKRIPVVEKDLLVSFMLYRALERIGAEIVGPVTFLEDVTLLLASGHLDGAMLDSRTQVDVLRAILGALRSRRVALVEACGRTNCVSGLNGCYKLTEVEGDLLILGRALFARTPSGDGESLDLHWNSEFACTSARTRLPSTGAAWHRRALITFAAASTLSFSTGFAADSVNHEIIMTDVRSDGHDFRQGAARAAIGCSSSHGACPLGQIKRDANPASIPTPMGAGVEAAALLKF